ncbi:patatin-like phospholipase family protein [Aureimonas leprariae]|uniref:PNPLA domain-containing protein n=1 Tax=Plantimonas leprariae TaxID=2615207 RepID=A0A7V7PPJ8_9HYPH|nr:patatin-like phospholipase family protein [Aureimonas leprariae]KAB0679842.1 hypothetical protein F6X38_11490 [Aureimonas leprariae]
MSNVGANPISSVGMRWNQTVDSVRHDSGKLARLSNALTPQSKISPQQLQSTQALFKLHVQEQAHKLGQELGLSEAATGRLMAKAESAIGNIVSLTFNPAIRGDLTVNKRDFKEIVNMANAKALESLVELSKTFGSADTSPQVIPFKDENGRIQMTVIKPTESFETLVLRGGGAKGIGNGAALVEYEKAGLLKDLKSVVGTSAGALTALGLASGMSAAEFKDFADRTDIADLKNSPKNFKAMYGSMVGMSAVGYGAGKALSTMDEVSSNQIHNCLSKPGNVTKLEQACGAGLITKEELHHLEGFLQKPDFSGSREGKMVTFGDLSAMSKVFPEFKELTLTGYNATDSKLSYFDAKTAHDMPVAIAGRISMSIPKYFASIEYDTKTGDGKKSWVDGGVGANMPTGTVLGKAEQAVKDARNAVDQAAKAGDSQGIRRASEGLAQATDELGKLKSKTLLMTFDEFGRADKLMHNPKLHANSAKRISEDKTNFSVVGWIAGNTNMKNAHKLDAQHVHDSGPNVAVVYHGKMDTLDLSASKRTKGEAALEAKMRALEFAAARQNQASHEVRSSAEDVVANFSQTELEQFVRAGPPDLAQFSRPGVSDIDAMSLYSTALEVYEKAQERLRPAI